MDKSLIPNDALYGMERIRGSVIGGEGRNVVDLLQSGAVYNAVKFLQNAHKRHPIAHPLGQDIRCILWAQTLIYSLPQSLQWWIQYHIILDRIITALDCIS